jgi:hypothetical protein
VQIGFVTPFLFVGKYLFVNLSPLQMLKSEVQWTKAFYKRTKALLVLKNGDATYKPRLFISAAEKVCSKAMNLVECMEDS